MYHVPEHPHRSPANFPEFFAHTCTYAMLRLLMYVFRNVLRDISRKVGGGEGAKSGEEAVLEGGPSAVPLSSRSEALIDWASLLAGCALVLVPALAASFDLLFWPSNISTTRQSSAPWVWTRCLNCTTLFLVGAYQLGAVVYLSWTSFTSFPFMPVEKGAQLVAATVAMGFYVFACSCARPWRRSVEPVTTTGEAVPLLT